MSCVTPISDVRDIRLILIVHDVLGRDDSAASPRLASPRSAQRARHGHLHSRNTQRELYNALATTQRGFRYRNCGGALHRNIPRDDGGSSCCRVGIYTGDGTGRDGTGGKSIFGQTFSGRIPLTFIHPRAQAPRASQHGELGHHDRAHAASLNPLSVAARWMASGSPPSLTGLYPPPSLGAASPSSTGPRLPPIHSNLRTSFSSLPSNLAASSPPRPDVCICVSASSLAFSRPTAPLPPIFLY
ncbi:hypothetical protein B0H13DRAFT_2678970 [Mycena leptocephala]|nr:hypothetical protein B0H13DRAFT_2678970 [Mycena leptocephala]